MLDQDLKDYVGRETPLYYAERLSKRYTKCVERQGGAPWEQTWTRFSCRAAAMVRVALRCC